MLALGTPLPSLDLKVLQLDRKTNYVKTSNEVRVTNETLFNDPVLLMVLCAHCPFVKHIENELRRLGEDYKKKVQIFAIASNSLITHPQDGPEYLAEQVRRNDWNFPYLLDTDQSFVKSLRAACTPDFFLFSPSNGDKQLLRYRGQLDSSRPGNDSPLNGEDLRQALNCLLQGKEVNPSQKPSIGCNIKWHPGKEPPWYG